MTDLYRSHDNYFVLTVSPARRQEEARSGTTSEPTKQGILKPNGLAIAPAQLALAWVLAQGDDIVPIPGTKRCRYLEENVGALDVRLTPEELTEIDSLLPPGAAAGPRHTEQEMRTINR